MSGGFDRERLVAVLGMLGSAHDGEILAAARQAERMRQQAGMTWGQILSPGLSAPPRGGRVESVADAIKLAFEFEDELTDWEFNFVTTLRRQRSPVSPKQIAILYQIVEKVHRAEARAA